MKNEQMTTIQTPAGEHGASIGMAHTTSDITAFSTSELATSLPIAAAPQLPQIKKDAPDRPSGDSCCGGSCGTPLPRKPVTTEFVDGHCESCGKTSQFPADRDGKIEECPHCHEFLDVGELDWEITDFGEPLD